MHAAKLDKSKRLQRVYELLKDGRPMTTMQIVREANVCAVNSIISELRRNGKIITCVQLNKGVYRYQLIA